MRELVEHLKAYAFPQYRRDLLGKGSLDNVISDLLEDAIQAGHRIETLEAALREIADWLSHARNDGMQYAVRESNTFKALKIARAALDKDAEK